MNKITLLLFATLLQACNGHYIKDDNVHNRAKENIYELAIPDVFQVEKSSGGSFTRAPHLGRFLPGTYSLDLSFVAQINNRVYKSTSNINTTVIAEAGKTGRVDFVFSEKSRTDLKPNISIKVVDTTLWTRFKKYIVFELSNEKYNDVMFNYYNYKNPVDDISFNRAMYHIAQHGEVESQKIKALNYLYENIQKGSLGLDSYNIATYTVGVYLIILGDLSVYNKEKYLTSGYRLFLKSLENNYDLALKNHNDILNIMGNYNAMEINERGYNEGIL